MAKALYRQYRPKTFDQLLGQDKVVNVLKNQVINNNISHAYIFAGERGCGKTSAAKIFAKAINCLNPKDGSPCLECENCRAIDDENTLDFVEMDAASNRRIDDIRNIKDNVIYPPSKLKYKVYIIDEAHMITREAFNALLKIMEEPPKHLVFILATTEIEKIPKTILSRVQKFEFNRIDPDKIKKQIEIILKDLNISMENEAIDLIIRKANGAMRDALSILDQVISFNKDHYDLSDLDFILGSVDFTKVDQLVTNIIAFDQKESLKTLYDIRQDGKSNTDIVDTLISFYRDLMLLKISEDESLFENKDRLLLLKNKIDKIDLDRILTSLDIINEYSNKLKYGSNTDVITDVMVLRLIDYVDYNKLDSRIKKLERSKDSDIIDLVNKLVDNRLKNIDLSNIENNIISKEDDNIISEVNTDQLIPKEPSKKDDSVMVKEANNYISISNDQIKTIQDMILATSGSLVSAMFIDEGFNYTYDKKTFTIYMQDEFYWVFLDSKKDDIEDNISRILKNKIKFAIELGSPKDKYSDDFGTEENIKRLKEIFAEELIIK
uniref:DNA polymerase III subunit gamma/tau n=1 Tax=Anaerococcus mediterraneensis TaxID=1870984 RepID=UPI00093133F9|nr:DNA polymerase III subunit gamma/tau [Anaerococcus mediterraneensis]